MRPTAFSYNTLKKRQADSKIETIGSFLPFKTIITLYKKVCVLVKYPTYEIFPNVNLHTYAYEC